MRDRDISVRRSIPLLVLLLCIGWVRPILGAEEKPEAGQPSVDIEEESSSTQGQVTIAGQPVAYTVTVGDIVLRGDEGDPKAKMTFVSYLRDGVEDRRHRPVTFAFNGGPGSASVWVHLGAFGPKKAQLDDEGMPLGPPPGKLVDNEHSVLDVTDLVFIDPVETGWSRPAPGEESEQFTGFTKDVESVGEFIRIWLARHDRWASPKFIAGESYGTTRSAGLAEYLQDTHGMFLNGICLISSVVNWGTKVFNIGNDLPYALILPTYTATAWHHGKLPEHLAGGLEEALAKSEAFAMRDYSSALMLGDRLQGEHRQRIRATLAELSGLSEDYLERADLRVDIYHFVKELLRDQGLTVGRLDSRYTGSDRDDLGEYFEYDPSDAVVTGWFVSLLKDYLRHELGYENDMVFRHSAGQHVRPWDYHEDKSRQSYGSNAYANYAEHLRAAMHKNPYLKVLVMSGYYDLATPYFATDYTVDHMQLDPDLRGNIEVAYYKAGHMMYVRAEDLVKFRQDYLDFLRSALAVSD